MDRLNTQNITTAFNTPTTNYQYGDHFKIEVSQSQIVVSKPVSYEFRVAEYVNEKDEILKVGLQVAVFEHDNYGVRQLIKDFADVERVRIKL